MALSVSVICSPVKAHILELASALAFCKWNTNAFILRKKTERKTTTKTLALLG